LSRSAFDKDFVSRHMYEAGSQQPYLSVVIPVYCSGRTLRMLAERVFQVFDKYPDDCEIVFVDDGSSDDSWEVLKEIHSREPKRTTIIRLMRNFGQHNALMCGLRHTKGRYVVTMDDDLQNPPEAIVLLIEALYTGDYDLVYGVYNAKRHERWRNLGSYVVNSFFRLVFKTDCTVTSFRILRRELVTASLSYSLNFTYLDGLFAWNTQRIGQVTVEHCQRRDGRSGYSLSKLLLLALNLFTNFSLLPLQAVSIIGLLAAVGGLITGAYYVVLFLTSKITVPGYASIITAVLILGGVQLLALGMMGEYLGRVHLNINRKPQYTIREVCGQLPASTSASEDDRRINGSVARGQVHGETHVS
jgi:undecaprenyl-phosphate 4-deoxy-4-formamido-L-arabinose transferase